MISGRISLLLLSFFAIKLFVIGDVQPFLTRPCTREKNGKGHGGPISCFPINLDVIWGVKKFPLRFQGPWITLPLWPDFDPKNYHFWPPRAHGEGMAGIKMALNHVFLLELTWFEATKSFHDESPSQTDPAIVTWFWPKNHPFLRPLCT